MSTPPQSDDASETEEHQTPPCSTQWVDIGPGATVLEVTTADGLRLLLE